VLVVVFFTVACRVAYPVFSMLHLHVGTGVKSALQLTAPLLLHYVCDWVIGFHFLLLSWGLGSFLFQVVCWWGLYFLDGLEYHVAQNCVVV
jgi:hypothetical protein